MRKDKKSFDFDQQINRYGTYSYKWECMPEVAGEEELIPMWVADMDFPSPPEAIEAVAERAQHGVFGYLGNFDSYYRVVAAWMHQRFNCQVEPHWVSISPGVVPSMNMLVQALTNPGDKVIIQPPIYPPFFEIPRNNGCHVLNNQLLERDGSYVLDLEDLEAKARDRRTKMFFLCHPHNPVGRIWTWEELKLMGEICARHGVILVSDEIHGDLTFPDTAYDTFLHLMEETGAPTVICNSPAKTFNVPGLQISNVIIPDWHLRTNFENKLVANGIKRPNILGFVGGKACYEYGEEWLDVLRTYLYDNFQYLTRFVREAVPGIEVMPAQGTYLAWLDIRKTGASSYDMYEKLLHEAKVALIPGDKFGPGGEGFLRLNYGCPRALLETALQRMAKTIKHDWERTT